MNRFIGLFLCSCTLVNTLFAQEVEMATAMRSNGKIYVVVAVLAVIFIGLMLYLYRIDKRVKKLEQ